MKTIGVPRRLYRTILGKRRGETFVDVLHLHNSPGGTVHLTHARCKPIACKLARMKTAKALRKKTNAVQVKITRM